MKVGPFAAQHRNRMESLERIRPPLRSQPGLEDVSRCQANESVAERRRDGEVLGDRPELEMARGPGWEVPVGSSVGTKS